jgi:hypothetical protein
MDSNLGKLNNISNTIEIPNILNTNEKANHYNILHHPDITNFTLVEKEYIRHDAFFEKNTEYPLEDIHVMKPKINMLGNTITDITNKKYYTELIQKLFRISEIECISKLNKFNGDVYKTIVFG